MSNAKRLALMHQDSLLWPPRVRFARVRAESRALSIPALVRLSVREADMLVFALWAVRDAARLANAALDLEERNEVS